MELSSKNASAQLIESEERYRRLFETAQDGILILDASTGLITDANPFICKLTGYSTAEMIRKKIWDLGAFKNIIANKKNFNELKKTGYVRYENLPLETKDGKKCYVEFISNSYLVGDTKVIQCNIRDISDRTKIEKINNELGMMYKIILLCNQVLLHETTINALIEEMCKVLVSSGGFKACWLSPAFSESVRLIKPIAVEGLEESYFKMLNSTFENNLQQGVVATSIFLNKKLICCNLKEEAKGTLEQDYALKMGLSSVAVIPIESPNNIPYVLVIYGHSPYDFTEDIIHLLKNLAADIAFRISNFAMQIEHSRLIKKMEQNLNKTISAIASIVEQRDPYTAGHQRRVSNLSVAIAQEMKLSPEQIIGLHMAAVIHDIGKIQVPAEILSKPTLLSDAEYDIIKTHPKAGWEVL